jgi:hypothetical protein
MKYLLLEFVNWPLVGAAARPACQCLFKEQTNETHALKDAVGKRARERKRERKREREEEREREKERE